MENEMTFEQIQIELAGKLAEEEAMPAKAVEEAQEEHKEKESNEQKTVLDAILEEGKITAEEVETFKSRYKGRVFGVYFDKSDNYIYRYCTRTDWKDILNQYNQAGSAKTGELLDELIVQKCLLYPKFTPELKALAGAGTFPTLSKQIQFSSNFIPDEMAISLITKL